MAFFGSKQSAAVLKHSILKGYLTIFASKTGSTSAGNRVVFLDCYAGRGRYADGRTGSPAVAAERAAYLKEKIGRHLVGVYIERDAESCDHLISFLAECDHESYVCQGDVSDRLDDALKIAGNSPLLVFIDPFGLGVPPDAIRRIFARAQMSSGRRGGPPTEVLMNFIYQGYSRPAGLLRMAPKNERQERTRETALQTLDRRLGGDWWREIEQAGGADRIKKVAAGFRDRLLNETGITGWFRWEIARRWEGPPVYELILLTQYTAEAFWGFNEIVSKSLEDFYKDCQQDIADPQQRLDLPSGLRQKWITEIKRNLAKELAAGRSLVPEKNLQDVFGSTIGYAREMHVRAALNELAREEKTSTDPKGKKIASLRIEPKR